MYDCLLGLFSLALESVPWFLIQALLWRLTVIDQSSYQDAIVWVRQLGIWMPVTVAAALSILYLLDLRPGTGWIDILSLTLSGGWIVFLSWLGLQTAVFRRELD